MIITGTRSDAAYSPNHNTIGSLLSEVPFCVQIGGPSNHNTIGYPYPPWPQGPPMATSRGNFSDGLMVLGRLRRMSGPRGRPEVLFGTVGTAFAATDIAS
jgi:hypothetical protein